MSVLERDVCIREISALFTYKIVLFPHSCAKAMRPQAISSAFLACGSCNIWSNIVNKLPSGKNNLMCCVDDQLN